LGYDDREKIKKSKSNIVYPKIATASIMELG
jgi:hypothetical protein